MDHVSTVFRRKKEEERNAFNGIERILCTGGGGGGKGERGNTSQIEIQINDTLLMRHAIVTCAVPCRAFVKTEGPGRRMDSSRGRGHTGREIDHFGFSDCCCYFCCCYIPPLGFARIVFQTKQDARHSFFFGATALPALHRALGTATSIFCVVGKSFCNNWSVDSTRRVGKGGKNLLNVTLPSPSPSPSPVRCGAHTGNAIRASDPLIIDYSNPPPPFYFFHSIPTVPPNDTPTHTKY